jgi:hypothetical protein
MIFVGEEVARRMAAGGGFKVVERAITNVTASYVRGRYQGIF